jgi:hypothetical protein
MGMARGASSQGRFVTLGARVFQRFIDDASATLPHRANDVMG